jgi:lysozyme
MKPAHLAIGIAVLALGSAAAYAAVRSQADTVDTTSDTQDTPDPLPPESSTMQFNIIDPATNVAAFLDMIAKSEGTDRAADPYRACYGYKHTIQNMSEHPAITGEWSGEPLSAAMCKAAGMSAGCVSTAAGKYQIIKKTWVGLRDKLGLEDFSAASQDDAAIDLLRGCGALAKIQKGDIAGAIDNAKKIWASFPAAGYSQGERTVAWLQGAFIQAGGTLA